MKSRHISIFGCLFACGSPWTVPDSGVPGERLNFSSESVALRYTLSTLLADRQMKERVNTVGVSKPDFPPIEKPGFNQPGDHSCRLT